MWEITTHILRLSPRIIIRGSQKCPTFLCYIYLGTIWYSKYLSIKFDVWQVVFLEFRIFTFSYSFIGFGYFLVNFGDFQRLWKNKKSKMADLRWPPFENLTSFLRDMTSPADVAYLQGNLFGRTICSLRFVAIALIFSELRRGAESPSRPTVPWDPKKLGLDKVKKRRYQLHCDGCHLWRVYTVVFQISSRNVLSFVTLPVAVLSCYSSIIFYVLYFKL